MSPFHPLSLTMKHKSLQPSSLYPLFLTELIAQLHQFARGLTQRQVQHGLTPDRPHHRYPSGHIDIAVHDLRHRLIKLHPAWLGDGEHCTGMHHRSGKCWSFRVHSFARSSRGTGMDLGSDNTGHILHITVYRLPQNTIPRTFSDSAPSNRAWS
ncbi:hypothetical protein RRG08_020445 [Elysia crispata]|uniref:Uncharacterized protein n=1 Tax=Elysia crispata TaxID=231223 RepID=A0AAE1EAN6_9GAST|nr:hypothetical protein RRG08_020445 [Elysia crispata]